MRTLLLLLLFLPQDTDLEKRVGNLVKALGSERLDDRDAAEVDLLRIGPDARKYLEPFATHKDPELRTRVKNLLARDGMRPVEDLLEELRLSRTIDRRETIRKALIGRGERARPAIEALLADLPKKRDRLAWYCANMLRGIKAAARIRDGKGDLGLNLIEHYFAVGGYMDAFYPRKEIPTAELAFLSGLRVFPGIMAPNKLLYACDEKKRRVFPLNTWKDLSGYVRPATSAEKAKTFAVQLVNLVGCMQGPDLTPFRTESAKAESTRTGIVVVVTQKIRFRDDRGVTEHEDSWRVDFNAKGALVELSRMKGHEHFYAKK